MATVSLITPPAKMCKPSVQPLNAFAVSVQWVPPVDVAAQRGGGFGGDRDLLVKGYRLRYRALNLDDKPVGEFVDVCEKWPAESSQATLKWLKSGLAYTFEVLAFNDAGEGDWSYASEPFLMPRKPDELDGPTFGGATAPARLGGGQARDLGGLGSPGQEGQPLAISQSADSIELSWKPPCHRGAPLVAYDIKYSKDPKFTPASTRDLSISGTSVHVVVEGLDSNTIYYFMHRARNEVGSSSWSKPSSGIATLARAPSAPIAPVRLGPPHTWQATEITIKWEAPESDGMPIQHYHVNVGRQPDMEDALEVEIGNKVGSGTITGHAVAAPSTPRPGFSKNLYALTQLRVRGLRPNTEYYFQVCASNSVGRSPWGATSVPMRMATAPPDRCGEVKFISGSCRGGIRMYWPPPDSYELPITRYDVRVSRSPTMKDAPAELSCVEVAAASVDGAEPGDVEAVAAGPDCWWAPGADHYCQVRAWNEAGAGQWSLVSETMPVDPEPPAMPDAPRNFTSMPTAIVVHWTAPNPLGSPITGYCLRYSLTRECEDPVPVDGLEGVGTDHAVINLKADGSYFFQVAAINAVGQGPWSPASQPVSVLQLPPVRMDPPVLVQRTRTSVTVSFTELDSSDPVARQFVRSYTVLYKQSTGATDAHSAFRLQGFRRITGADPAGVECVNLSPGKACEVRVLAANDFGEGDPSEPAIFETANAEPDPPRPPVLVEAEGRALEIAAAPGSDNGDALTHFYLQVEAVADGQTWEVGPLEVAGAGAAGSGEEEVAVDLSHRVDGLLPGHAYRFRAAAENSVGRSAWSAASEDLATAPAEPEAVAEVQVVDVGSMSFRLKWDKPHDNGAKISMYTVSWMVNPPEEPENNSKGRLYMKLLHREWTEVTTTETTFTCEDCVQGCVAWVKVAAHNEAGMSPFSEPTEVQLRADVPFAPLPPHFSQVSFTSFRVNWAMLFDGGGDVKGFRIHFVETDTDGRPEAARDQGEILVDAQKMYRDVYNLCPKREYIVRVAAENSVGVGPFSAFSSPQRLLRPQPPAIPGKPVFVSSTVTTLKVKVQLSQGNGANVLEQVFRVSENPQAPASESIVIALPSHASVNKPFAPRSPPPGTGSGRRPPKAGSGSRPGSAAPGGSSAAEVGSRPGSAAGQAQAEAEEAAPVDGISEEDMRDLAALRISGEMRLKRNLPGELTFELPRLKGGTTYYVSCAARNSVGLGFFGPVGGPMVTKQAAPLATTQVAFAGKDAESVTVSWDVPDTQGSAINIYAIRCLTAEAQLFEEETEHVKGVRRIPETRIEVTDLEDPARPSFRIRDLLPGTTYFAAVRALNSLGWSPWVRADFSCRTDPMPPAKMDPLSAVMEERTQDSITLEWTLPDPRGSQIRAIELRYINLVLECGSGLEATEEQLETVLGGQMVIVEPAGVDEPLPTRYRLEGLKPHSVVVGVARALNSAGAGEWSNPPCRDLSCEILDVDCTAEPAEPSPPQAPHFELDSLTKESGKMTFVLGDSNGLLYTALGFRLFAGPPGLDALELEEPLGEEGQEPLREWHEEMPREEKLLVLQDQLHLSRFIEGLEPGTVYAMQARAENPVGTSAWSSVGPSARTKPDRPRPGVLLVDHTSPVSIWVKWRPPHHNGAAIKGYGLRWNDQSSTLAEDEWNVIPEDVMASSLVKSEVTRGALVYKMNDLVPNRAYHFQICSWNAVGRSDWCDPGTFFTRPSAPDRPHEPRCHSIQSQEATLEWGTPDDFGSPITRYEVVCARSRPLMLWCRLVSEKLWWAPNLDVVFGLFGMADQEMHDQGPLETGRESLLDFHSEEAFCCEVDKEQSRFPLAELLPGKEYHTMVRAVSAKGNGKWSPVCSFTTEPARPRMPQPLRVESVTAGECHVSYSLPHANGKSISEAVFAVVRLDGPLADGDVDPSTGDAHPHHARRELTLDPYAEPFDSEHGEERYASTLPGLLPGTEYEVSFACRNECGLGDFSDGTTFSTKSGLPDMPESLFALGGF